MKKLSLITIFFLFFLSSCGYQSLLVTENINFSFNNIEIEGEKNLSQKIANSIEYLKNPKSTNNILIKTKSNKNVSSKDKKGNPEVFNINISVSLDILEMNGEIKRQIFDESISYNNLSSKFELKQKENKLTQNIIDKISKDILIYLRSI